jgi:hypothetical protein
MNIRFLTLLTTLAFLGLSISVPAFAGKTKDCGLTDPHPSCKTDDELPPGDLYTITLNGGPFKFVKEGVAVGSKGDNLTGGPLTITYHNETSWDTVFMNCAGSMTHDSIKHEYVVAPKDWSVKTNSDSDIHITINGIFAVGLDADGNEVQKEIDIHLDGDPGGDFLPTGSDNSITYDLDQNIIWGKPWSGPGRAWDTCYSPDNKFWSDAGPSKLIISR